MGDANRKLLAPIVQALKLDGDIEFDDLLRIFEEIKNIKQDAISMSARLALEETKTLIMQTMFNELTKRHASEQEEEINKNKLGIDEANEKEEKKKKAWWRQAALKILLLMNLGVALLAEFYGYTGMLTSLTFLITGLTNPMIIAISVGLAIINTVFYLCSGMLFGDYLTSLIAPDKKKLIEHQTNQIKLNDDINNFLIKHHSEMSLSSFTPFASAAKSFNSVVNQLKQEFKPQSYPVMEKLYWTAVVLGTLLATGGGYYLGAMLASSLALSIAIGPIGWAAIIIGFCVVAALGSFYVASDGLRGVMMPTEKQEKALDDELKITEIISDETFELMKSKTSQPTDELKEPVIEHEYKVAPITQTIQKRRNSIGIMPSKYHNDLWVRPAPVKPELVEPQQQVVGLKK